MSTPEIRQPTGPPDPLQALVLAGSALLILGFQSWYRTFTPIEPLSLRAGTGE